MEDSKKMQIDMAGRRVSTAPTEGMPAHQPLQSTRAPSRRPTSAAEEWIRHVSPRIGLEDVALIDTICSNLRKEYIAEEWQLSALDSHQWQQLGAPMGLAAAIRKLSSVHPSPAPSHVDSFVALPSVLRSSSRLDATGVPPKNLRSSYMIPPSSNHHHQPLRSSNGAMHASFASSGNGMDMFPPIVVEEEPSGDSNGGSGRPEQHVVETDEEAHAVSELESGEGPSKAFSETPSSNAGNNNPKNPAAKECKGALPVCARTFTKDYNKYKKLETNTRSMRTFPATQRFQQALLHSKSGPELKAHTVFWMELSILASALFLGAAVEMWGAFPMGSVSDGPIWAPDKNGDMQAEPHVPRNLAIVYNFIAGFTLITFLFVTSGWIWILHATAAVSPFKFHQFLLQTRYVFKHFLFFSEVGLFLLNANICILFSAMVAATTTNQVVLMCCYYLPGGLIIFGCIVTHHFTSYIGRVAYHGLLLMDEDRSVVAAQMESKLCGSAEAAEAAMAQAFQENNIICEAHALDVYHHSAAVANPNAEYPSLLDVIFPKSQSPAAYMDETDKNK